jgi:RNA polymerase sigma-70 factor, ECF subfamily
MAFVHSNKHFYSGPVMDDLSRLALLARDGDESAFAALVRSSQHDVYRFCSQLTDRQRADDLVQEVFLRVWKKLGSWRAEAPVKVWLLGIARYVVADDIRRRSRRRRLLVIDPLESLGNFGAETARARKHAAINDDPVEQVITDVTMQALVAMLDHDQATAFVVTQVLGLSYAEAADICEVPIGTIRSRVARARSVLANAYGAIAEPEISDTNVRDGATG